MLPPGPRLLLLAQHPLERLEHRIERGDVRQSGQAAALLQAAAHVGIDQSIDDQARALDDFRQHALEMTFGAYHRPEMLDHLDPVELGDASLCDHLECLAGRIR